MAKRTAKKTANSGVRFDDKRTRLKTGEIQRKNGTYEYRWTTRDGKRHSVYAPTLDKLREYEEQVIGGCGQNLGPYGYPADKFGVRIPLDCLYSRGLIPPRESLIRFSQYQCRY